MKSIIKVSIVLAALALGTNALAANRVELGRA